MAIGNKRSLNFKNIEMFAFKVKVVAVSFLLDTEMVRNYQCKKVKPYSRETLTKCLAAAKPEK